MRRCPIAPRVLDVAMQPEYAGELNMRREGADMTRDRLRIKAVVRNRRADVEESVRQVVGEELGPWIAVHEIAAFAVADHRFELWQMHGDDRTADRQRLEHAARHTLKAGGEYARMHLRDHGRHARGVEKSMQDAHILDGREFGEAMRRAGADIVEFDRAIRQRSQPRDGA